MSLPAYIKAILEEARRFTDSQEYKVAAEQAKRFFEVNRTELESLNRFLNENKQLLNNELKLQLESINYIRSIYPDLGIAQVNNKTRIESSDRTIAFSIESVGDIVSIQKLTNKISIEEAVDFFDFITEHPMLGYMHETGKKIFAFVESSIREEFMGKNLYRIRGYTKQRKNPYSILELIGPPFGVSPMNRFNNTGMNVSYFSEDLNVLKKEVDIKDTDRYTIIEVELIEKLLMLDIRDNNIPLFKLCQQKTEKISNYYSVEYVLPNYISDCARKSGFDGIMYKSAVDQNTTNFVFFYLTMDKIRKKNRWDYLTDEA